MSNSEAKQRTSVYETKIQQQQKKNHNFATAGYMHRFFPPH